MLPVRTFRGGFDDVVPAALRALTHDFDTIFKRGIEPCSSVSFDVDVRQDGEDLLVTANVPGLAKDDIDISVENEVLTISGEYKNENDEKKGDYHVRERQYGKFSRSFRLPNTADSDKVAAELKNGVLTLTFPTREEAKPRRIEVR